LDTTGGIVLEDDVMTGPFVVIISGGQCQI